MGLCVDLYKLLYFVFINCYTYTETASYKVLCLCWKANLPLSRRLYNASLFRVWAPGIYGNVSKSEPSEPGMSDGQNIDGA
jgi:hypothetical protein